MLSPSGEIDRSGNGDRSLFKILGCKWLTRQGATLLTGYRLLRKAPLRRDAHSPPSVIPEAGYGSLSRAAEE